MPKVDLTEITSGYTSTTAINANNDLIEAGFDNTLSRDGTTPNQMEADLDMNSNDVLNVQNVRTSNLYINGSLASLGEIQAAGKQVKTYTATAGQTLFTGINAFTQGTASLDVYINGVYQDNSTYAETSTTSITFSEGLDVGDYVVIITTPDQTVNVANASAVPYTPSGGSTTNVSDHLQGVDAQLDVLESLVVSGTGSPEGVVTASVGTLFLRSDGSTGTTLYVKETGASNTGWVAK